MDTLGALAGIVFGWVGCFVLLCCCAVGGVLVEGEELSIFDDGEFVGGECGKLGAVREMGLVFVGTDCFLHLCLGVSGSS